MMLVCFLLECVVLKRLLTKILVFDAIMSQHKFDGRTLRQEEIGHAAKLKHLRVEALDKGRDWLQREVARVDWQEVRQLAQAAGLQVRSGGHGGTWLQVGAVREALVKHLEPQAMSISKHLYQIGKRKVARALL